MCCRSGKLNSTSRSSVAPDQPIFLAHQRKASSSAISARNLGLDPSRSFSQTSALSFPRACFLEVMSFGIERKKVRRPKSACLPVRAWTHESVGVHGPKAGADLKYREAHVSKCKANCTQCQPNPACIRYSRNFGTTSRCFHNPGKDRAVYRRSQDAPTRLHPGRSLQV
jgi:hypothetical protein